MIDFGTDIDRTWQFTNGDIQLTTGKSNLGQAILKRLTTEKNLYDMFYDNYGSNICEYFGEQNNPNIQEYIRIEVETTVIQDPRIQASKCTVLNYNNESIELKIDILTINEEELSYNFVLNENNLVNIINSQEQE